MAGIAVITTTAAFAADSSKSYDFYAAVNGQESVEIQKGDSINLTVTLKQTSSDGPMTMYAVNDSIRFNSELLQLDEKSIAVKNGITYTVNPLSGSWSGWTDINIGVYSKAAEGDEWNNSEVLFEAKFTAAKAGSAVIQQRSAAMYTITGMDTYNVTVNSPSVTVKSSAAAGGSNSGNSGSSNNSNNSNSGNGSQSGNTGGGTSSAPGNSTPAPDTTTPDTTPGAGTSENVFSDVSTGAWYADAVKYVTSNELFNGTGKNTFSLNARMTRAMMVTVLHRMAGKPAASGTQKSFSDISTGMWYTDAIAWASENGIVNGYSNGTFGVNDSVTREQLAAILYRYAVNAGIQAEVTASSGAADGFADSGKISSYARTAVEWAVEKGLVNGKGNNRLDPAGTATRAELAAILMRFNESIVK